MKPLSILPHLSFASPLLCLASQVTILHVCLTVALTLIVNASTSGAILKRIGLTKLSPEKVSMLQARHVTVM